ncbi:MAG: L-histidine N(alpha)-methyltransferase [Salibacteraceae bacterium]
MNLNPASHININVNSTTKSSDPAPQALSPFAIDIRKGLWARPKKIPSKYFYDEIGSKLFQDIMNLDEYYLTDCEYEVLDLNKSQILDHCQRTGGFDIIELGAGDGYKTKVLLRHFLEAGADFTYRPVDISTEAIDGLVNTLQQEIPDLQVNAIVDDYFQALNNLKAEDAKRTRVVLFLGSNVGNLKFVEVVNFLEKLKAGMKQGDLLLTGFDLRKDPDMILAAYNDSKGVTAQFNLNLLNRMNRELGAEFDLSTFKHYPFYDAINGEARSCLVSKVKQSVYIAALDDTVDFEVAEIIKTEVSRKYFPGQVEALASRTGFSTVAHLFDAKKHFLDALWSA